MSNPFLNPTPFYMYMLQVNRLEIMTAPTEAETAVVKRHWNYLLTLEAANRLVFAGRTLVTNGDGFASVIFRAGSEEEARATMEADPVVIEGIMRARLFPYQPMLIGSMEL